MEPRTRNSERPWADQARGQYLLDAKFHAEVNQSVSWVMADHWQDDRGLDEHARTVATEAVIRALWLRDSGKHEQPR